MNRGTRILRTAMLLILLGVITSIAVAWGIAAWAPLPTQPPMAGGVFTHWDKLWATYERASPGRLILSWAHATGDYVTPPPGKSITSRVLQRMRITLMTREQVKADLLSDRDEFLRQRPGYVFHDWPPNWGTFALTHPPEPHANIGADWSFGWPMRCMWFQTRGTVFDNTVRNAELRGGYMLSGAPSAVTYNFRALPLRPIAAGLLINSLIFTIVWMILLLTPRIWQRALRKRRGWCVVCGYDLRGQFDRGCPECGRNRTAYRSCVRLCAASLGATVVNAITPGRAHLLNFSLGFSRGSLSTRRGCVQSRSGLGTRR